MASAWPEEDTFVCPVCLETLKDPATLPCGHSYCLACIQIHWDKGDTKGQYSCPQCRQVFNPRPSLSKSTVLVEAMEKLRANSMKQRPSSSISSAPPSMPIYLEVLPDTGPHRQGSVYPQLPTVAPRPCPQHQQPLELFCREDKECVCVECCLSGHKGHHVVKPQEERRERQRELAQMQADVQRRMQETEKKLKGMPQVTRQNKALVQALQAESADLFSELVKSINVTGTQVGDLLSTQEASLGGRAEGQIHRLEQELAQLRWKGEELSRMADMQDHICFLKNFLIMEPPGQTGATAESVTGQEEAVVASIRSAMTEFSNSVQDLCKGNLAKIFRIVNDGPMTTVACAAASNDTSSQAMPQNTGVYEMTATPPPLPPPRPQATLPPIPHHQAPVRTMGLVNPEPQTREDMLKFHFEPTMDPDTAYRHLLLSDGGHKATLRAENLNPPDQPERFQFWRQVLCREPLAGSPYYWEVEWTGQKVTIGMAYKEMERKSSDDQSRLGHNPLSWGLYWSGTGFSFWHGGQETPLGSPKARRVGVYLDQHAGFMSFYRIINNQAHKIYRHQTQFTGPLYPGFRFWAGVGATMTVCERD